MALHRTLAPQDDARSIASSAAPPHLPRWVSAFERVHVDLGTGDGAFAIQLARREPRTAVIGLDTNLDRLRGSRRRHPGNLRFVRADGLDWPPGLLPAADTVTISFPYGSLLRGLVGGDAGLLDRLGALLASGGRLEARVNETAFVATGLDPRGGPRAIAASLRRLAGMRVEV